MASRTVAIETPLCPYVRTLALRGNIPEGARPPATGRRGASVEFEWRDPEEFRGLLKTRRFALALLLPVFLVVFLIYTPEKYAAYRVGVTFVMGGLRTVLKGVVPVSWAGRDEVAEGCFATGIGILAFCIGVAILIYALQDRRPILARSNTPSTNPVFASV